MAPRQYLITANHYNFRCELELWYYVRGSVNNKGLHPILRMPDLDHLTLDWFMPGGMNWNRAKIGLGARQQFNVSRSERISAPFKAKSTNATLAFPDILQTNDDSQV